MLMGLMFTGLIFGPFVYLIRRNKQQSNTLITLLTKRAAEGGLTISHKSLFSDRIIGLDQVSGKLLFFRIDDHGNREIRVDLHDALDCTLTLSSFIIQLEIRMIGMEPKVILSFMDESDDPFDRRNRLPVALEWEKRISDLIDSNFIRPLHAA